MSNNNKNNSGSHSYAAVASAPPAADSAAIEGQHEGAAPPPYVPGPSAHAPQSKSPRQTWRPQNPNVRSAPGGQGYDPEGVVFIVSPRHIAAARARARFFGALFWAFLIYLVAGSILGGGIYDVQKSKHDAEKHRKHHPNSSDDWRMDGAAIAVGESGQIEVESPMIVEIVE